MSADLKSGGVKVPEDRRMILFCVYCFSLFLGLQTATQVVAFMFDYQDALGWHVHGVYPFWGVVGWAFRFFRLYPDPFYLGALLGSFVYLCGVVYIAIRRSRARRYAHITKDLYGSAHWANREEIVRSGLLKERGLLRKARCPTDSVLVGAWVDEHGVTHYLWHSGPEHVFGHGPSRSGKGVALIIPTLLAWTPSCFVRDLKGELWAASSGWRLKYAGNFVVRFAPGCSDSEFAWNPLNEIRVGESGEIADATIVAHMLLDPDGAGLDDHWKKTASALLVGIILHCIYVQIGQVEEASLAMVAKEVTRSDRKLDALWEEMSSAVYCDGGPHPYAASQAQKAMNTPKDEFGSTVSTLLTSLTLYLDPAVAATTSRSDFRVDQLMHSSKPMSLFLVTTPENNDRMRPFVRLMMAMMVRRLASRLRFEEGRARAVYKHRLLLLLDEFASLGRMSIFQGDLAYIAGYGIKAYFICQDYKQMTDRKTGYGENETITSNCHVQVAFTPNQIGTAEHISKRLGKTTVIKNSVTHRKDGIFLKKNTVSYQEVQRDLMTPDELMCMKTPERDHESGDILSPGDMIVMVGGLAPIYGIQPLYFQDRVLAERAKVPPGVSDKPSSSRMSFEVKL